MIGSKLQYDLTIVGPARAVARVVQLVEGILATEPELERRVELFRSERCKVCGTEPAWENGVCRWETCETSAQAEGEEVAS